MSVLNRFPSYEHIYRDALTAFGRFPLTLISAIVGSVAIVYRVHLGSDPARDWIANVAIVSALGLPLFTALAAFIEKRRLAAGSAIGLQLAGVVLLVLYYISLPGDIGTPEKHLIRFALLFIGFHFLVAVLPYTGRGEVNGFWQFNKSLFLRFLMAALYSAVLFGGLAIALAAADHLFGMAIDEERYLQLWILTVGIFNTWVFLGGIPRDLNALDRVDDYPKGLKVFTQFILLPLVALYFVILIAYELKIIIAWDWPRGWVSQLVLWYAVVGILSMLFLYPLKARTENRWIQVFVRWFFRGIIPLVVMLFLAIWVRISEYGFTEPRYFVLAMAVGLLVVVIYFIISRQKDPRIIPAVLCLLALLSAYGPWSAISVSVASQKARLETLMIEHDILGDNGISPAGRSASEEDQSEISSIVRYLAQMHGLEPFSEWLSDSTMAELDTVPAYRLPFEITEMLGVEYGPRPVRVPSGSPYFSYDQQVDSALAVKDYDYVHYIEQMKPFHSPEQFRVAGSDWEIRLRQMPARLEIINLDKRLPAADQVIFALDSLLVATPVRKSVELDPEHTTFVKSTETFDVSFTCTQASGWYDNDQLSIEEISGYLLLRLRE